MHGDMGAPASDLCCPFFLLGAMFLPGYRHERENAAHFASCHPNEPMLLSYLT